MEADIKRKLVPVPPVESVTLTMNREEALNLQRLIGQVYGPVEGHPRLRAEFSDMAECQKLRAFCSDLWRALNGVS